MARTETLASPANPLLKEVRRALHAGTPTADGCWVAETLHLLEEAVRSGLEVDAVLASEAALPNVEALVGGRARVAVLAERLFDSTGGVHTSQGVLALVRPPAWTQDTLLRGAGPLLLLDGVQDPGNAGAMVRAAEAFGAAGVVFLKGSVSPHNSKTLRASAGSLFRVPALVGVEPEHAVELMRAHAIEILVTVPRGGDPLHRARLAGRCALVIGSESRGAGEAMRAAGRALAIPTAGVESLNAAMAATVVLYEAWRQRSRA